jgi:hypothetical protein
VVLRIEYVRFKVSLEYRGNLKQGTWLFFSQRNLISDVHLYWMYTVGLRDRDHDILSPKAKIKGK